MPLQPGIACFPTGPSPSACRGGWGCVTLAVMSSDDGAAPGDHERVDAGHQRRLDEFDEHLDAGEFDLGLELSWCTGAEGLEQQRQAFAFAAWAARVSADPAEDFDAFVDSLWQSVKTLHLLAERVGATDGDVSDDEVIPTSA